MATMKCLMFMVMPRDDIYIAFLPLAHVLELLAENTMMLFGVKVKLIHHTIFVLLMWSDIELVLLRNCLWKLRVNSSCWEKEKNIHPTFLCLSSGGLLLAQHHDGHVDQGAQGLQGRRDGPPPDDDVRRAAHHGPHLQERLGLGMARWIHCRFVSTTYLNSHSGQIED